MPDEVVFVEFGRVENVVVENLGLISMDPLLLLDLLLPFEVLVIEDRLFLTATLNIKQSYVSGASWRCSSIALV